MTGRRSEWQRFMTRRFFIMTLFAIGAALFTGGCGGVSVPNDASPIDRPPAIWPDYAGATIPSNIAPLNFNVREKGDAFVTLVRGGDGSETTTAGAAAEIPERVWKQLLAASAGQKISFTVYVRNGGKWSRFAPFFCGVSDDRIDPFVAYRLIEPGYEYYRRITLNTRSLETFREEAFFDNAATGKKTCVNCHSFQDRRTENFLFHARGKYGGTMLVRGGKPVKLETKSPALNLPAVYPSWHPTLPLVAFSANKTKQLFHSIDPNRIEVFDLYSDLVLYDAETNRFTPFEETRSVYETFPSWSPDGNALYYCAAQFDLGPECDKMPLEEIFEKTLFNERYADFKYSIMKRSFDAASRSFGPAETVVDAAAEGKSAIHPRVSPDGRFLIYTKADYGTFPIWHRESDLWLLDLTTGERRPLDELNSADVESWHSWSSSGRWLVFSSRRDDGSYTRLYFAHFNENGTFDKPFLLPQKNPEENIDRMKSYNVPEFITEEIPVSPGALGEAVRYTDAVPASYDSPPAPHL